MQITIQVYDKDGVLTFDLPEDTNVQQIKTLVADNLNLSISINDITLIFNQRIINNNSISLLKLGYNAESKIVIFFPRFIRSANSNFRKSSTRNIQPNLIQNIKSNQGKNMNQTNNPKVIQNNNNYNVSGSYMKYTPLSNESPLHSILQKLSKNILKVSRREGQFENPWKIFLLENNTPFLEPQVQKNFEIASKLNEGQVLFICDAITNKKAPLAYALNILANASYDPNIARKMI